MGGEAKHKVEFEVVNLPRGFEFYHGSFYDITGDLRVPYFTSQDQLQSVAHLLVEMKAIFNLCRRNPDIVISSASGATADERDIINRLTTISKCFPILYKLKPTSQFSVLKMKIPSDKSRSFDLLVKKDILLKYLMDIRVDSKRIEVLSVFQRKLNGLGWLSTDLKATITLDNFETIYSGLFDKWNYNCDQSCFAGWANTPIYYLLSQIDYNSYFKEIELIDEGDRVSGLFIERDQQEIAIFSDTGFRPDRIVYPIFPYDLLKKNVARDYNTFFNSYRSFAGEILNGKFDNFRRFVNECVEPYTYFTNDAGEKIPWEIDFYRTKCDTYNPRAPIAGQSSCADTCRNPVNPTEDQFNEAYGEGPCGLFGHSSEYLSSKYTIRHEANIPALNEYLTLIIENGSGKEHMTSGCGAFAITNRSLT